MLQFKFPFEALSWRPCWLFTEAKGNDLQLPALLATQAARNVSSARFAQVNAGHG